MEEEKKGDAGEAVAPTTSTNNDQANPEEEEKLGWDGEPLLTPEELKRQEEHFAWMIEDNDKWEEEMTDEEKLK